MPVFLINCEIDSENVTHVRPASLPTRIWGLQLKCTRCNEVNGSVITIDPAAEEELNGGTANHQQKCSACKSQISVSIVQPTAKEADTWVWSEAESKKKGGAVVAAFDCRGAEIEKILPEGKWIATNVDADLTWRFEWKEGEEWAEYEEDLDGLATISSIKLTPKRG